MPERRSAGWDVLLVRGAVASLFVFLLARTWADPDLWGHLRFGRDIAVHGVRAVDAYTFTGLGHWLNPSWLADLLMYGAWAGGGTFGLIGGKLAVAAGIVAVTAATLRRAGVHGPALDLLLLGCIAAVYSAALTVRPQLIALLLFAVLVHVQAAAPAGERLRLVVTPVVMALWANLHGSWVLGLAEVALWSVAELLAPGRSRRQRVVTAATVLVAALATLATPYGVSLWWRLSDAFTPALRDVSEWRSLLETSPAMLVVWAMLTAMALGVVVRKGVPLGQVLVLAWLAWSSWRMSRLLPFFGLATLGFLGGSLRSAWDRGSAGRPSARSGPMTRSLVVGLGVALILAAALGTWRAMSCLRMDHRREADVCAASFIAGNGLRGRMLTYSDWGLYAVWHFAPQLRVSLDGRREFAYPMNELGRHGDIYWNAPTAVAQVEALAPDYVWLPRMLPVIPTLVGSGSWKVIFESERSVVLARPAEASDRTWWRPAACTLPACFPADPVS